MPSGPFQALPPERRAALLASLQRRAELLRPGPALLRTALQRCVRHDRRSGRIDAQSERDSSSATNGSGPLPHPAVPTEVASAQTVPEQDPGADRRGPDLRPGSTIEGYRIERMIGAGGMGMVYEATQISMNRRVAFKVLSPRLAGNETFRGRFVREARNAGRLQHPNLIAVHDVSEVAGLLFFSMELVEGQSVGDLIKRDGAFDEVRALAIIRQALEALIYAHANGLVHRDIKPDNLMLTANGTVKIADLGLSRGMEDAGLDGGTTKSGTMMGTPYYMPPEQGRDAHTADHRADIYAMGATLYHMVCGKVPYTGRTAVEVVVNATTKALQFPNPAPSSVLRKLIARLMAKKPEDRPASAQAAMALVDRVVQILTRGGSTENALNTGSTGSHLVGERGLITRLLPWILSAAVAVAVLLGGLVWLGKRDRADRWSALETTVAGLVARNEYAEADDHLKNAMSVAPDLRQQAIALRQDIVRRWNDHTREGVDELLADIDAAIEARDFAWAMATVRSAMRDPALASPEAQVLLKERTNQVAKSEAPVWTAVRTEAKGLLGAGDYRRARYLVESIQLDDRGLRKELEDLLHRIDLAETSSGSRGTAFRVVDWLDSSFDNRGGSGQIRFAEDAFWFDKDGRAWIKDLPSSPDELTVALTITVPDGGQFGLTLNGKGRVEVIRVSSDVVRHQRLDGAGRDGRRPLERLRERIRDPEAESRSEVVASAPVRRGGCTITLALLPETVQVRVSGIDTLIEVPRRRGGGLCLVGWQSGAEPIRMAVE